MNNKAIGFLLIGLLAGSGTVLFFKASIMEPVTLAAFRLLIAAFVLSPVYILKLRKNPGYFNYRQLKKSLLPGVFLAIHFVLWIIGGRMTPAVNATMISNLFPVIMPFLLFFHFKEKISRNETIATLIIIGSLVILLFFDFDNNPEFFIGDIVCFVGMIFVALYMIQARIHKDTPDIYLYIVPVYFVAGIMCLITAVILEDPFRVYQLKEYLLALGLGLIPTVIGHSSYNYAMRYIRGQVVAIIMSTMFIFSGIWAYFLFNEIPGIPFIVISVLIFASTMFVIITHKNDRHVSSR